MNQKNLKITKLSDGVKVDVKVLPNSSKCEISGLIDNSLKIKLNVPPIEGKANEKCIKFLSKELKVPKSAISIVQGEKTRNKTIYIKGDAEELYRLLISLI